MNSMLPGCQTSIAFTDQHGQMKYGCVRLAHVAVTHPELLGSH